MPSARRAAIHWLSPGDLDSPSLAPLDLLAEHLGLGLRGFFSADECHAWARGVYAGRGDWVSDFGGEQFSLGRAFYTHLEQGRARAYFEGAKGSDARVEALVPGLQHRMIALVAQLTRGHASPRRGWCGPGIHIFPAGEHVSRAAGVVHFDTEGLSEYHLEKQWSALTAVAMLQPPEEGGGLRLWDVVYAGCDEVGEDALGAASVIAPYGTGDVIVIDSYRLHQIQPFSGKRDRISATVHAACVDRDRWETWF